MSSYFIRRRSDGKIIGPVTSEQIFKAALNSQLFPDDEVSEDQLHWYKASVIKKLEFAPPKLDKINRLLHQRKATLEELEEKIDAKTSELTALEEKIRSAQKLIEAHNSLEETVNALQAKENELREIESKLAVASDTFAMESIGIYERRFGFESSVEYKKAIDECVKLYKAMVKAQNATKSNTDWVVAGDVKKGQKMIKEQSDLMLRAFNGEFDAAVAKVKHGNFETIYKRVERAFEAINKLGKSKDVEITTDFFNLRLRELRLAHEHEIQKQEEKEREREIRAQIAEEAKAEKEIEQAKKKAEKEESLKAKALDKARAELAEEHGKHNEKLQLLVAKLETELKDAIDLKAKATARAQLTKSGHVYILSNIGTMGELVFKIGMTRRLDPQERVTELGDASVPFPFDVHAMIYTENAPELEKALHDRFADNRVNLINLRKEYFNVTIDEIIQAVAELHGEITFVKNAEAEQYRATLAKRQAAELETADA